MTESFEIPSPSNHRRTIAALITPRGRGAVAVVAIAGPEAESVLNQQFQAANNRALDNFPAGSIIYGLWKATGEDLVVYRRGDNDFEVQCHGGNSASAAIFNSLEISGVEVVSSYQFTGTFMDLWRTGVRTALCEATTTRTAEFLLQQLELLPNAIAQLDSLVRSGQTEDAIARLELMLKWSAFGKHLTQPRSIVLCGQPNVGKSSLTNSIVGFERAIVHSVPGTTRDVVSQLTAIDGWPVELKDTAGLREATETVEVIGIERARAQIESADVRVCVFDLTVPWCQSDARTIRAVQPHLVVHNKSDLAPDFNDSLTDGDPETKPDSQPGIDTQANRDSRSGTASQTDRETQTERETQADRISQASDGPSNRPFGMITSAETGLGIPQLIESISHLLAPELPGPQQPFPVTATQSIRLESILDALKTGDSSSASNLLTIRETAKF